MHRDQYASSAQALAATEMCAIPNQALRAVADHAPVLNRRLFELMGRELSTALDLAGDYTAEQRVAAFLLQMDQHANEHGELRLEMSRRDIANWLRLVTETVSRVLTRFRDDGIISVSRRSVIFHDLDRLRSLAGPLAQSNAVHSRQSDMLLQHAA
ncbi:MAG: Crp/Fnr family transcriptional regulator [Oceanococcus sp.]